MELENKIGSAGNATEQQTGHSGQEAKPEAAKNAEASISLKAPKLSRKELIARRRESKGVYFVR